MVLAAVIGILSAIIIIAFRIIINVGEQLLPGDSYSSLPVWLRFALPLMGSAALYGLFRKGNAVGVVHVMERLAYHQARLPWQNAVKQFFGAIIALLSGHSVGREGPSVHLGAATASLVGQRLKLPNNTIRTLVGSGIAAAIAASFNTPLAGVIFAVEVVLLEYSVLSMAPVIMAAVTAAWFTHIAYHAETAFVIEPLNWSSNWELPYLLLLGLGIGLLASGFNHAIERITVAARGHSLEFRFLFAGLIAGLAGVAVPDVMGLGYSVLGESLSGQLGLAFCLLICAAKLLSTTAAIGLGIPGGLIGPSMLVGAMAGHATGIIGNVLIPELAAPPAFYALLGMAAMMGAVLQAPLAALLAILELTNNPNVILPGMMVVITAMITSRQLFNKQPIFVSLMTLRGLNYLHDPLSQHRRSMNVAAIMSNSFRVGAALLPVTTARLWREKQPDWVVFEGKTNTVLIATIDIWRQLDEIDIATKKAADELATQNAVKLAAQEAAVAREAAAAGTAESPLPEEQPPALQQQAPENAEPPTKQVIDLFDIPATRIEAIKLPYYSSVQDALDTIDNAQAESVVIYYPQNVGNDEIIGVITRDMIKASYR